MASARWLWDKARNLFTRGKATVIPVVLRDAFTARAEASVSDLAGKLTDGELTLAAWSAEMATRVRATNVAQFLVGIGGRDELTSDGKTLLGQIVVEQLDFLRGFAQEISAGGLTREAIAARSALFFDSSIGAYERGRALSLGRSMPIYPPVHPRCRCNWDYDEDDGKDIARWITTNDDQVCPICTGLASEYDRLVLGPAEAAA